MWDLDHENSWELKNWCFWSVVLEKTALSPLDCKEIKPVGPNGNQSWIFIGRTDSEAEAAILWLPDEKNWLIGKDPDAVRLRVGEERDDRGWDGWMASPTWWTWVWASSRSWWWTGKSGEVQPMGSQRVGHDWVTELNWAKFWGKIFYTTMSPELLSCDLNFYIEDYPLILHCDVSTLCWASAWLLLFFNS